MYQEYDNILRPIQYSDLGKTTLTISETTDFHDDEHQTPDGEELKP